MFVTWPLGLQVRPCHWQRDVDGSQLGRAVSVGSRLAFSSSRASSWGSKPAHARQQTINTADFLIGFLGQNLDGTGACAIYFLCSTRMPEDAILQ